MAYDGTIKIDTALDTKGIEKGLKGLGALAVKGSAAAVAALATMSVAAIKVGSDFEAAMSQVAATMGTTVDQIPELTAIAKEMGAATQFSATQAAEALNYLALAGYSAEKSISVLPDVLNLAAAGGMDLAYASDLVTDSMAVLGLGVEDLTGYTDQMAKTAQKSNTNVAQLGEAILIAGGQAKLAGMDTVQLNTALGILADNGIKGSEGGTALRNALKNLYTPTSQSAAAMEALGIQTANADGSLRGAQDVLQDLSTALDGLTEADRMSAMSQIFDTRTIAAANALLKDSGDRWNELSSQIGNAEGAAAAMAATMNDNLQGDITIMKSALEGLGIQVYETFQGPLREAVQAATSAIGQLASTLQKPDMQNALNTLGQAFSSLVKIIANTLAKVIPIVAKAFATLADNIDIILPALATFGVLIMGLKIASMIKDTESLSASFIKAAASALGLNTALVVQVGTVMANAIATGAMNVAILAQAAATKLAAAAASGNVIAMVAYNVVMAIATAATWLFNAALAANPVGLVIAGIVALVGVVAGLIAIFSQESDQLKQLKADTEAVVDANNQLQSSMADSAASYDENISNIEANAGAAGKLADRLFDLQGSYDGSAQSAAKMRVLVGQLNEAMPELNLQFDEQTGQLNMTEEAVRALIAAQKDQLLAQARLARASELAEELIRQEESLRDLTDQYAEWELALEAGEISQRQFDKNTKDLVVEIGELETSMEATNAQIDQYIDTSSEAALASEEAAAAAAYSEENLTALANQYGTTVEAIRSATDGTVASLDAWQAAQDETAANTAAMEEAMVSRYEELAAVGQDAFNRIEQAQTQSVSQMIGNLEANTEAMNMWAENLAAITDRTASGELSALQPLIDQLAAGGPEYAAQLAVLNDATDEELAALAEAFATGGDAAMQAMMAEFGLPANTDMGADAVDDIAAGVENSTALADAGTSAVNDMVDALNTAITAANFPSVGKQMIDGMASGVRNNASILTSAITSVVNQAVAAAKAAADIASPSKKMKKEWGLPMVQGMAGGISENASLASDAIEGVVSDVILVAQGRLNALRALAGGLEFLPGAYGAAAEMHSASMGSGGVGAYASVGGGTTTILNLTMDVTSPTALDEYELTREAEAFLRRAKHQIP